MGNVKISKTRQFRYFDLNRNFGQYDFVKPNECKHMTMRQFIDKIHMRNDGVYYFLQSSLLVMDEFITKQMSKCLDIARHCGWGSLMANNLLIGMKGTVMPLHCEQAETILFQCHGYSEIILFAPATASNLYPFPYGHPCSNLQSMVNLEFIDKNPSIFKKFKVDNEAFGGTVFRGILR